MKIELIRGNSNQQCFPGTILVDDHQKQLPNCVRRVGYNKIEAPEERRACGGTKVKWNHKGEALISPIINFSISFVLVKFFLGVSFTASSMILAFLISPRYSNIIHYNRGGVLRIIQADEAIKILVNEKNLEMVKGLFPNNKIIKIDRNLAEINMHLHPQAVKTLRLSLLFPMN
jgi:hypothetical protein